MAFDRITELLKRFRNIEPSDAHIKEAFIAVVAELFGETVDKKEIDVQQGTIYLRVHPALKSEIYIKKQRTLELLNKKLQKEAIKNIV